MSSQPHDYGLDLGKHLSAPTYWRTGPMQNYRRFMSQVLGGRGQYGYQANLQRNYDNIARTQRASAEAGARSYRANLGTNNPSGMLGATSLRTAVAAPYGQGRLDAEGARRREMYDAGRAFTQSKMAQTNMWTSVFNANTAAKSAYDPWQPDDNNDNELLMAVLQAI